MKKLLLIVPLVFAGCKKCVECEIRLKQSQDVIGFVDEFCGNDKKVEEEEQRLRADYNCIECCLNRFWNRNFWCTLRKSSVYR